MRNRILIFLLAFFVIAPKLFNIFCAAASESGGTSNTTDLYNSQFYFKVPEDKKDVTEEKLLFHIDLAKLREAESNGSFSDLKIFFNKYSSDFFKRDLKGFSFYQTYDSADVYIRYSFYQQKYAQIIYYLLFPDGTKSTCLEFFPSDTKNTTCFDVNVRLVGYDLTSSFDTDKIFSFDYSTPTEDLDNYNFDGVRFAYPNGDYTGEENRYQMTCNVKFRIPIDWSYLENKVQSVGIRNFTLQVI